MSTKNISDLQVVQAYAESKARHDAAYARHRAEHPGVPEHQLWAVPRAGPAPETPEELLHRWTMEHPKVCMAAMGRACDRGLVEYGVSLRTGWLTEAGKALLDAEGKT